VRGGGGGGGRGHGGGDGSAPFAMPGAPRRRSTIELEQEADELPDRRPQDPHRVRSLSSTSTSSYANRSEAEADRRHQFRMKALNMRFYLKRSQAIDESFPLHYDD